MASTILSDNGVTSGSAGLKTTAASDGALALQTTTAGGAATTALTINTSQNVLVGTTTQPSESQARQTLATSSSTYLQFARTATTIGGSLIGTSGQNFIVQTYTGAIGSETYTERMRIDTSGNVGIGTSSPTAFGAGYTNLAVSGSTSGIVQAINSGNSVTTEMICGTDTGRIGTRTNHALVLKTNDTERMRINAGAPILCLSGGSTTATGTGIAFPATQSASSDANTLDDYEEGTWTPIDSSGSGLTFAGVSAYYTKIGNMVFATFALTYPASSSSATNVIGGLPFTSATGNAMNAFNVSYTSYSPGLMAPIDANLTSFTLYDTTTTNSINNTSLLSKAVRGTCIYKVA